MDSVDASFRNKLSNEILAIETAYGESPDQALASLHTILLEDPPSDDALRGRILLRIAQAYFDLYRWDEANKYVQQARLLIDSQQNKYEWAIYMTLIGRVRHFECNFLRARDLLRSAMDIVIELPTTAHTSKTYFDAYFWDAKNAIELNQLSLAVDRLLKAFSTAYTFDLRFTPVTLVNELSRVFRLTQEYTIALELSRWAFETSEDPRMKMEALINVAASHLELGNYRLCVDTYNRARRISDAPTIPLAQITMLWGQSLFEGEDLLGAEQAFDEVEKILSHVYCRATAMETQISRSRVLGAKGKFAEAMRLIVDAPDEAKSTGSIRLEHLACTELGYLHRAMGNYKESLENYQRLQSLQYEANLARQLAEIYQELDWSKIRSAVGSATFNQLTFQLPFGGPGRLSAAVLHDRALVKDIHKYVTNVIEGSETEIKEKMLELQQYLQVLIRTMPDGEELVQEVAPANEMSVQELLIKLNARLTPMEAKICSMIRSNYSSKAIAHTLGISTRTVDTHRTRIRKKLGLGSTVNLQTFLLRVS